MSLPDPYRQYPPVSAQPVSPGYQGYPPVSPPPMYPPAYYQTTVITTALPSSGVATASLVLGIIGVLGGWCMFGIPCILAVAFGHAGLAQTRDGRMGGRGMAVAGLILGYVFVAPMIVLTAMVFFGGVLAAVSPGVTPTPTP